MNCVCGHEKYAHSPFHDGHCIADGRDCGCTIYTQDDGVTDTYGGYSTCAFTYVYRDDVTYPFREFQP